MGRYAKPIDISTNALLRQIAEQVRHTGQPVPLTQGDEVVAVVEPAPSVARASAIEAIFTGYDPAKVLAGLSASAGALVGTNRDELLADIQAQRGQDSQGRPE
jgi:hypothetical protein